MTRVFLDTVGMVALWNLNDQWNRIATEAFQSIPENAVLTTTAFVLLECGNAVSRTPFRTDVDELRIRLEKDGNLVRPSKSDWRQAWENYGKRVANSAGIVDQVSFVVMKRLGITDAFTNDQHFRAAGFVPLF
jgi:predicted nucleic acid-binding protein